MPLIVTLMLCTGFVALLNGTADMLPDRVASHFGPSGTPDSWMSKGDFLGFSMLFGLGMPLAITAICSLCTLLPDRLVNLPHKEHWLSAALRKDTRLYIIAQSLWLSCLLLLMTSAMHGLVIQAHCAEPIRLPMGGFAAVMGAFVAGVGIWLFLFLRHFSKP